MVDFFRSPNHTLMSSSLLGKSTSLNIGQVSFGQMLRLHRKKLLNLSFLFSLLHSNLRISFNNGNKKWNCGQSAIFFLFISLSLSLSLSLFSHYLLCLTLSLLLPLPHSFFSLYDSFPFLFLAHILFYPWVDFPLLHSPSRPVNGEVQTQHP